MNDEETLQSKPLRNLDFERLRRDLLDYYDNAFFGGCGNTIVFTGGLVNAEEPVLIEYANAAGLKLERYER